MIRSVTIEDAKEIVEIYNYYILNTNITFEEKELDVEEMERRIELKIKNNPWTVYEKNGQVLGYAYLSEWHERSAYRFSKEVSIYLHKNFCGVGIGKQLLENIIDIAKEEKYNTKVLVSGITIPNDSSIGIHERFGFEKVAEFKKIGFKNNEWLNVGYWQLIL